MLKFAVCCCYRDGISVHIDEVEPSEKIMRKYGFSQMLKGFFVEKPPRNPAAGALGKCLSAADFNPC